MRCTRRLVLLVALAAPGCARELTLEPTVDPSETVEAQFDPTNPIPVLQIVPSPTGLAQRRDAPGLNVTVQPCEVPSTKQCLAFVTGWPTTTPITLYFSGRLKEASVKDGVKLFNALGQRLDYTFTQIDRPPPNPGCMNGDNGSMPARTYTAEQIPPGIALILTPAAPLSPGARYAILVESDAQGGLRSESDKPVEPSGLFSLLNRETSPVEMDGTVTSPLLRSQVQGLIIAALYPTKKSYDDLTEEEAKAVDAAVKQRGQSLLGLWTFFDEIIRRSAEAGLTSREKLVLVNGWSTGEEPTRVAFDPTRSVVPFPNLELLSSTSSPDLSSFLSCDPGNPDRRCLDIPINPCGETPTPGCQSPSSVALLNTINTTLDGFSTTSPIYVPLTGEIDEATLEGNVVMYPLNDQGMISGELVELDVRATETASNTPATIQITPVKPLQQNTVYVVGIKKGIKDKAGKDVASAQVYELLKSPAPIIDAEGKVLDAVKPQLQCARVSEDGMLGDDAYVAARASLIEKTEVGAGAMRSRGLNRPRWQETFEALEGASTPIPRTEVLMAFTYKTQDITRALDVTQIPGVVPMMPAATLVDVWNLLARARGIERLQGPVPGFTVTGTTAIAAFLSAHTRACVPLCQGGFTQPAVPPTACVDAMMQATPELRVHPVCRTAVQLAVGSLRKIELYQFLTHKVTRGSPYIAGGFDPRAFTSPQTNPPKAEVVPIWVIQPAGTSSTSPVPVVIYQHGLTRTKEDGFQVANVLASDKDPNTPGIQGAMATVLMDLPYHGSRASDVAKIVGMGANATAVPCAAPADPQGYIDPANVTCDRMGVCTGGCDNQRDPSGTGALSANLFAVRDNFRQGALDILGLKKMIKEEGRSTGRLPFLDGTQIAYVGQSFGSIHGGIVAAYSPDLKAAVFNVVGGGIPDILLGTVPRFSTGLFLQLAAAGICTLKNPMNPSEGCVDNADFRRFLQIARWVIDPGDPLASSIGVKAPHGPGGAIQPLGTNKILIQMVTEDPVVPNPTTRKLGIAYDFDPDNNSMMSRYQTYNLEPGDPNGACHFALLQPNPLCTSSALPAQAAFFGALCATVGLQQQAAAFIVSNGATIRKRGADLPPIPGLPALQCPNF